MPEPEEFTKTYRKQITSLKSVSNIKSYFVYPKLVTISNTQSIRVVDAESSCDDEDADRVFNIDGEIRDTVLQGRLLWVVLSSGELMVLDLLSNKQLKLHIVNYANYQIQQLKNCGPNMLFISKSEEVLVSPYSMIDVENKIKSGLTELEMTVEKAPAKQTCLLGHKKTVSVGGMDIGLDNGIMYIECPITGLREEVPSPTNLKLKHIMAWGEVLVLADDCNMWALDLNKDNIVFEFKSEGIIYHPLGSRQSEFYYLSCDGTETQLNSIQKTVDVQEDIGKEYLPNNSIKKSNSQELLKSQVRSLIEMAGLSKIDQDEISSKIKSLFEQIDDVIFLIDIGIKFCYINIFYKPVLHLLQRKVAESKDKKLIKQLYDSIFKLDIMEYIIFKGNTSYKDINILDHDYRQLCIMFISNADFDLASMCWLKSSEIHDLLTADDISALMNAIPHNAKMGALLIWLKNLVPTLLDENPFHIDLMVRWTTERVFILERAAYWPKIGLKFIDDIVAVLESSLKTIAIRPISMDDLDVLKDRIIYIMELKEKYKLNMLLGELSAQNPSEVVLIMLHRCYTEDLAAFLQDYLPTFATRHSFELDDILRSYVESEANSGGGNIDGVRLQILVNAFRVPSNKLECLLTVLRVLDVPWDTNIHQLAVSTAALAANDFTSNDADRNLAREIREEVNYANLKVVLKKYNFPLTFTDYISVIHKIVDSSIVDVKDLKLIMSVTSSYRNYGSILYIERCLRDCKTKEALEYYINLSERENKIILKSIMSKYEHLICNNQPSTRSIERCYIDFFKGTKLLEEVLIVSIEKMYYLKNTYNMTVSMNDMYCEEPCTQQPIDANILTKSAIKLNQAQSHNFALINSLQRTSMTARVREAIETILVSYPYVEDISCEKMSTFMYAQMDGQDNSTFLVEANKVLVHLLSCCAEEHMFYLTKIMSFINAVINSSIVMKNLSAAWKFHYIFIPMSSLSTELDFLRLFIESENGESADSLLPNTCIKSDFLPIRVLANQEETFSDDDVMQYTERTVVKLLSKICVAQETDELFVTSLLLMLDTEHIEDNYSWLHETLKGQSDTLSSNMTSYLSSPVVRRIFALNSSMVNTASYTPQFILKSKYNMTLADIALPDITEETWDVKLVLFYVLKQQPSMNMDRLIDLCHTLNVGVDDGLSLQIIALLTTWDLKHSISKDDLGRQKLYVENDENTKLNECLVIWESIKNKGFIKDILNDFWKNGEVSLHGRLISINPYFYEVYLCIYCLIYGINDTKNIREYYLLNFLKDYKRKSHPQQYEFELFSAKGMFPEIGHYRLPFHLFMRDDMWSNLKSEITLETYELWLPAVALLSLDNDIQTAKDMICSNALKETMKSRKTDNNEGDAKEGPWRLATREEPLLRAAHRCVRHIANMEWAGACLFYVLQGCGRGADQVAAAQLCYQFAQRWDALEPGNRAVRKMERLHATLSTRHALHKIDWASDELVQLLTEPVQLIRAMYLHHKFVGKSARSDVNGAVNDIADKNGINISSIRIQILENILEKVNDAKSKTVGLDHKDLMTAKYILKATCPKMGAIYLSRIAFDEETDFNKHKKLRALQCLMSIVEPDTALKVTNRTRDVLWHSILELYYTIRLEMAEMPWAVGSFAQDKLHTLEQIIAAIGNNTDGLKLTAELARRFGDTQIIVKIIRILLRAAMFEDMVPLLQRLLLPPDELICKAWRAVILSPFQNADYPITERQKSNCLKTINLLPQCPVIRDEDLKEIWSNCVRCKCYGIGCLVLPYMTVETRQSLNELRKIDRRNLIVSLKNLQSETYLISGAMYVVENLVPKGTFR